MSYLDDDFQPLPRESIWFESEHDISVRIPRYPGITCQEYRNRYILKDYSVEAIRNHDNTNIYLLKRRLPRGHEPTKTECYGLYDEKLHLVFVTCSPDSGYQHHELLWGRLKSDFCCARPVPDATTAINKMTNAEYVILEPEDDSDYANYVANNELTKANYYAALQDADT